MDQKPRAHECQVAAYTGLMRVPDMLLTKKLQDRNSDMAAA
jgi:hypothetical protein